MSCTRWAIGCILFLAVFAWYLHGAAPSVSVGDSGEFITSAITLGIPHPSGFPSYTIAGHVFASLIPWANPGFRVNLFSAAAGAASVALFFGLLTTAGVRPVIALAIALFFAGSPAQRFNSQATEVFELHLLFCVGILWSAVADEWPLTFFLLGLGACNHQTIVLLVPALAVLYACRSQAKLLRRWVAFVAAFAAGFSANAFIFIRAARHPELNVGNADTLERWWRVITRADFGSLTLALGNAPSRTLAHSARQIERFVAGMARQCTPAVLAITFLAVAVYLTSLLKKRHAMSIDASWPRVASFLLAFSIVGPGFYLLGNLPFDAQSVGLLERFYIVPLFCWIAAFALICHAWLRDRAIAWAMLLLPLVWSPSLFAFPQRMDLRAYSYGRNNLRTLPVGSTFIMDGGDDTFYTVAYLTQAERRRPDIRFYDRGSVVFPGVYGDDVRQLPADEREARKESIERAIIDSKRPLYFSTMNSQIATRLPVALTGFLYGSPAVHDPAALWSLYDLRQAPPWTEPSSRRIEDYRTRALLPFYTFQRAAGDAQRHAWDGVLRWIESAHVVGPDVLWLEPNVRLSLHRWAYEAVQQNAIDRAAQLYRLLVWCSPTDDMGWQNLGAVYQRMGKLADAARCQQRAIEINPTSAAAHFNLAATLWRQSRWPDAIRELQRTVELDPAYPNAAAYLARAQREHKS